MKPRNARVVRLVARHPTAKTTKTACVSVEATFADAVKTMFPDLAESTTWTIQVDGNDVDSRTQCYGCQYFVVEWAGYRPLAPCSISVASFQWPVDAADQQICNAMSPKRWVRTPFKSKPQVMQLDENMPLTQIAASFVSHTMLNVNVMCQVGGAVIDPALHVSDIPITEVMNFKVAPLLGGAKSAQFEDLKSQIRDALELHGVSKDQSHDRMLAFAAKADLETISKTTATDPVKFWDAIKQEANRVKFRLVYRNEMQAAKKEGRKPPSKVNKRSNAQQRAKNAFVANPSNIKIDITNFKDGEDDVPLIDASRFGPDQKGLAIMTLSEANRHAHNQTSSLEALAILIVGSQFDQQDEVFTMPAFTKEGSPIIVQAALRQYGDRPVEFRALMPQVNVSSTASTTVELHIYRSEVAAWKECSVPLHYIGVHISAIRGDSLISTWSLKSWNETRQQTPFREASYWHGYFRVQDSILEHVLQRSGSAGIYLTPRTADRRHDDRYAAITMPNRSLSDMQKLAADCDKALGIVRVKDQLAIRCKREDAPQLRTILLPESAYVASATTAQDEQLWVLKHVPNVVGKAGLDEALRQSEWDARVIRAQGLNRWIVASREMPKAQHLNINGSFVLAEPLKRQNEQSAITMIAKQVKVDALVSTSDGSMQVSASSRYQEIKAEVSDFFEAKLAVANDRIERLAAQLEQAQETQNKANLQTQIELNNLRDEQSFHRQKIQEVESSVIQSGQTVIQTMQSMMQQMQANLEGSMQQLMRQPPCDESKRPRTEQPEKNDQFATRG